MGQKVIIRFWWESGSSCASRNHPTTFCRPFIHYACLKIMFRLGWPEDGATLSINGRRQMVPMSNKSL